MYYPPLIDSIKGAAIDDISYWLNEEEKTAKVIGCSLMHILDIPESIKYESQEYIITSIVGGALTDFFADIYFIPDMLYNISNIKSITLPSTIEELEEGWCCGASYLTEVKINPNNPYFKIYDDKFILGKSNKEQQNFDVLVFCPRDVVQVTLPDFIEIIDPFAFEGCFQLKKIIISNESKLRIIKKFAFSHTSIKAITFPSKLIDVEEGWCRCTKKLNKINISPNNPYFKIYDDKFILGKSNKEQQNFDVLVFCPRDVVQVTLPDFIEIIGHFAFNNCNKIEEFFISKESKLRMIGKKAFFNSSIKSINFPPHLTQICDSAFQYCKCLKCIQIDDNSELSIIEDDAFSNTSIESFEIPVKLTKLGEGAFQKCSELKQVEIPCDSQLQVIDKKVFAHTSIEHISTSSNLTKICEGAFYSCKKLKSITIVNSVNTIKIEKKAFFNSSSTKSIIFPSTFVELESGWLSNSNLKEIIVSPNNPYFRLYDDKLIIGKSLPEKEYFDVAIWLNIEVESIKIPSFIEVFESYLFRGRKKLQQVDIPDDSNLRIIKSGSFKFSNIKNIKIPPKLTKINKKCFYCCSNLKQVEIPDNSELQIIEKQAFSQTSIEEIILPSSLKQICENAFSFCKNLKKINIPKNSELEIIEKEAFLKTSIRSFWIPSHVTHIGESAFGTSTLQIIEINDNIELTIDTNMFKYTPSNLIILTPIKL